MFTISCYVVDIFLIFKSIQQVVLNIVCYKQCNDHGVVCAVGIKDAEKELDIIF